MTQMVLRLLTTRVNRILPFVPSGPSTVLCTLSPLMSPPLGQVRGPEGISIVDAALLGGTMGQPALVAADTQNNRIQGSLSTTGGGFFLVGLPNGNGTGNFV